MANEITVSLGLSAYLDGSPAQGGYSAIMTMNGDNYLNTNQNVGTSPEALDLGDVSAGLLLLRNEDATNYVDIGLDSGLTKRFLRLRPGQISIFSPSTWTLYAQANTATVQLGKCAVESIVTASGGFMVPTLAAAGNTVLTASLAAAKAGWTISAAYEHIDATMTHFEHHAPRTISSTTGVALFAAALATYLPEYVFIRKKSGTASSLRLAASADSFADFNNVPWALLALGGINPYLGTEEAGSANFDVIGMAIAS